MYGRDRRAHIADALRRGRADRRCVAEPALGRDNDEVYGDWLGLPGDEIDSLQAEEVI